MIMKRWLSRRKRDLIECAPISDALPSDRAMRSALESARTIPEAAASLTTQQQFDQALAKLTAQIVIPKEVEEWFVNAALIKGAKRSWVKTAGHPAILATALAVLVMTGIAIFFFVERLHGNFRPPECELDRRHQACPDRDDSDHQGTADRPERQDRL